MKILCEDSCSKCGTRMIKNPHCSGDFYPVQGNILLMRFCPSCGVMKPEIEGQDPDYLSNNAKKAVANRVATIHNLGYSETKKIATSIYTNNKHEFARLFSMQINIPLEEIRGYCK